MFHYFLALWFEAPPPFILVFFAEIAFATIQPNCTVSHRQNYNDVSRAGEHFWHAVILADTAGKWIFPKSSAQNWQADKYIFVFLVTEMIPSSENNRCHGPSSQFANSKETSKYEY